jgi:hypothetical protein
MEQAVVRIDGRLALEVRTYCRITGLPITQVLDEAVNKWLESTATARLSGLHEDIKARGPKAKLNGRELELLGRYEQTPDGGTYHLHNDDPVPMEFRPAPIFATDDAAKMLTSSPVTGVGSVLAAQGGGMSKAKPVRKRSERQREFK